MIPTGSPTSEPAWFCQCRPGCKPQPLWPFGSGQRHFSCTGGSEPHTLWVGMLTLGTAAAMLCTNASMQQRKEGAVENRMLALLCAALWQTGYFTLSFEEYDDFVTWFKPTAPMISQPSKVDCQLTLWQKDQLQQLGSSMSCNHKYSVSSLSPSQRRSQYFPKKQVALGESFRVT